MGKSIISQAEDPLNSLISFLFEEIEEFGKRKV